MPPALDGHRLDFSRGSGTKKYRVVITAPSGTTRTVQFGDKAFSQYRDSTPLGLYAYRDHLDPARRADFQRRHRGVLTKDGRAAYKVRFSPAWFSWHYLW
jgi:hypothetical protein